MSEFRNEQQEQNHSDFRSQLRHYVDKRIAQGIAGIGDYVNGKVNHAVTETKNYWMDENVFEWCCEHAKATGVAPAQYAACMMNTIKHGNEFMMPSAFRIDYARQKLNMNGYKITISERLKP